MKRYKRFYTEEDTNNNGVPDYYDELEKMEKMEKI